MILPRLATLAAAKSGRFTAIPKMCRAFVTTPEKVRAAIDEHVVKMVHPSAFDKVALVATRTFVGFKEVPPTVSAHSLAKAHLHLRFLMMATLLVTGGCLFLFIRRNLDEQMADKMTSAAAPPSTAH